MNKILAFGIRDAAQEAANNFSNKDREGNYNGEIFKVLHIFPMTDTTACVIMDKSSGKQAAFFFYHIARGASKGWKYFVPSDSHILGMENFNKYKLEVEAFNYKHNF